MMEYEISVEKDNLVLAARNCTHRGRCETLHGQAD